MAIGRSSEYECFPTIPFLPFPNYPLSLLRPQLPVAVLEGDRWTRGLVTDISSSNFVKVFFVDGGVDKAVAKEKIRLLKRDFVHAMPMAAYRCSLEGVIPVDRSKGWSPECLNFFKWV